jgi:hypothetical protein
LSSFDNTQNKRYEYFCFIFAAGEAATIWQSSGAALQKFSDMIKIVFAQDRRENDERNAKEKEHFIVSVYFKFNSISCCSCL